MILMGKDLLFELKCVWEGLEVWNSTQQWMWTQSGWMERHREDKRGRRKWRDRSEFVGFLLWTKHWFMNSRCALLSLTLFFYQVSQSHLIERRVFLCHADDDERGADPWQAQTEVLLGAEDNSAQWGNAPGGEPREEQLSDTVRTCYVTIY